jgi:hypothetical protein
MTSDEPVDHHEAIIEWLWRRRTMLDPALVVVRGVDGRIVVELPRNGRFDEAIDMFGRRDGRLMDEREGLCPMTSPGAVQLRPAHGARKTGSSRWRRARPVSPLVGWGITRDGSCARWPPRGRGCRPSQPSGCAKRTHGLEAARVRLPPLEEGESGAGATN